jgi:hypothetical protein
MAPGKILQLRAHCGLNRISNLYILRHTITSRKECKKEAFSEINFNGSQEVIFCRTTRNQTNTVLNHYNSQTADTVIAVELINYLLFFLKAP